MRPLELIPAQKNVNFFSRFHNCKIDYLLKKHLEEKQEENHSDNEDRN